MRISPGGEATVRVALPMRPFVQDMELVLNEGPEGLTVESAVFAEGSVTLQFKADAQKVKPGTKGNLIVEGFVERAQGRRDSGKSGQTRRVSIGVLPAIPFEILEKPGFLRRRFLTAPGAPHPGQRSRSACDYRHIVRPSKWLWLCSDGLQFCHRQLLWLNGFRHMMCQCFLVTSSTAAEQIMRIF